MLDSIMDDEDSHDNGESDSSMSSNVGLTDGEDIVSSEYGSSECGDVDDDAYAGDISMASEAKDDDVVSNHGDLEPKTPLTRTVEGGAHPVL